MQTRRSVRDFKPDMVPEDIMDKIIEEMCIRDSIKNKVEINIVPTDPQQ